MPGVPAPGQVLVGKYRVESVLGVGGMGVVVAATHLHLDERVAIKFLHAQMATNPEIVTRFLREGKSCIKIRSEHAVKVHDVGTLDNGAPYLVMEYLDGTDLAVLLEKQGPMQVSHAVDFILQACEAIAEAHTIGIVHRDLKPANLFLTHRADGSPSIKVLDFGISKAISADGIDSGMTRTQSVMGSPRYMSPEQMRSTRDVDQRTDIWAIGVILYELFSGLRPFEAETMTELCAQILQDSPQSLVLRGRRDIPAPLDAAVLRCLSKNPEERFANLGQLAMALGPFASPEGRASAERVVRVMQARGVHLQAPRRPMESQLARLDQPPVDPQVPSNPSRPGVGPGGSITSSGSAWGPTAVPKSSASLVVILGIVGALVVAGAIALVVAGTGKRSPFAAGAATSPRPIGVASAAESSSVNAGSPAGSSVVLEPIGSAATSAIPSASAMPAEHPAPASAGRNPGNQHPPTLPSPTHPAPAPAGTADMFNGRH
jgi:serine/threonine protein kinase